MGIVEFVTWVGVSLALVILTFWPAPLPAVRTAVIGAVGTALVLGAVTAIVFAPDDYTQSGSNWSNRGASSHRILFGFVAVEVILATAFVFLVWRRLRAGALRPLLGATGFFSLFAGFLVLLAFEND